MVYCCFYIFNFPTDCLSRTKYSTVNIALLHIVRDTVEINTFYTYAG